MKHFSTLLLVAVLFLSGCQREISSEITGSDNLNSTPVTVNIQGNITDETGQPAAGVTIKAGMETATTNASGYFRINNAMLDKNASLITAEKTGYFKAYRTFCATSGTNQAIIKLMKKVSAGTINAVSGGETILSNGSKIALPANSIVAPSSGVAYTGTVNIFARYIDPTAQDIAETFPGSIMANDKDGKRVILESFGMLAVELESATGEKLQIATGQTATLTTAIPSSLQSTAPATIPLWYVDEQTGIWKEEGAATKIGSNYVGEVKHFSLWNCDISVPAVTISATIKNADHLPLVNTCVRIVSIGNAVSINGYAWTDSLGQIKELIPANQGLDLTVLDPCHTAVYSKSLGSFSTNTDIGSIYTSPGASIVTIRGKLAGCSGEKLTSTYAVVSINNMIHYAKADANGNFTTSFTQCSATSNTAQIFGVDASSLQQGTPVSLNTRAPVTDAGTMAACGSSLQQYINYTIDGTNYIILDSLDAYTVPNSATAGNKSYIFGKGVMSPDYFSFQISDASTPGTYTLSSLSFRYRNISGPPTIVTLTKVPQNAGEFYEGSFSWQFTESIAGQIIPHTLTCAFKMRRRF